MTLVLRVEFPEGDAAQLHDGWRGLVDFGEQWTDTDNDLWQDEWGPLPLGQPLRYGCELRLSAAGGSDDNPPRQGELRLWSLDEPRDAMTGGAGLSLFDGASLRASGRLASA